MNRGTTRFLSVTNVDQFSNWFAEVRESISNDFVIFGGFLLPFLNSLRASLLQIIQILSTLYLVIVYSTLILSAFREETSINFVAIDGQIKNQTTFQMKSIINQTEKSAIYEKLTITNQTQFLLEFLDDAFEQVIEVLNKIEVNTKEIVTKINEHTTQQVEKIDLKLTEMAIQLTSIEACACKPV